jgi:HrpA-like RNA helicase
MQIVVTQPRKIAAQELAGRVAFEFAAGNPHHAKQAGVVGFHVGGHRAFRSWQVKLTAGLGLDEVIG